MQACNEDSANGPHLSEALQFFARHRHVEPGRIARLICKSESFREICADYAECCSKLLNLEQKAVTAGTLVRDYADMREQLERDLLRCLEEPAVRGTRGGGAGQPETN